MNGDDDRLGFFSPGLDGCWRISLTQATVASSGWSDNGETEIEQEFRPEKFSGYRNTA